MAPPSPQIKLPTAAGPSSVVAALSVYVEPLVQDACVAIVGDSDLGLETRLLELGARTVHVYDPDVSRAARLAETVPRGVFVRPLRDDFEVRSGAFDLVVIPDVGLLPAPSSTIGHLRRVVEPQGAVVAMGRARTSAEDSESFPELSPSAVEYAELYDLFALQFEHVTIAGVVPFRGVVFAELGGEDDVSVSVDTRLVDPEPPGVFVVRASREQARALDPYAIVQVEVSDAAPTASPPLPALRVAAALAEMDTKLAVLAEENDLYRDRVASGDQRTAELEGVIVAAQQALAIAERRLIVAEEDLAGRDEQIAILTAALQERADRSEGLPPDVASLLVARAEQAEAALADHQADRGQANEMHQADMTRLEAQLRERAVIISELEKELGRREQLVRELVASLEESRAASTPSPFESAAQEPGVPLAEAAHLRRKLDELALEVARREGELAARSWRITELENERDGIARAAEEQTGSRGEPAAPMPEPTPSFAASTDLERELSAARAELDVLRQALAQEHAARVAAESGEELSRARAELSREEELLEQMRDVTNHSSS